MFLLSAFESGAVEIYLTYTEVQRVRSVAVLSYFANVTHEAAAGTQRLPI